MLTKAIKRGKYGLDEQSLQIIKRLDFRRCYMGKGHMPTKLEWRRVPAVRHLGLREVKGLTPGGMTDATRGCKKLRSVDLRRTPVTPARHSFARAIRSRHSSARCDPQCFFYLPYLSFSGAACRRCKALPEVEKT